MMFLVDAENTLAEAWEDLASSLRESGAQDYQIEAMKMTFFMGAAQAHMMVDAHSRSSRDEFNGVMDLLRSDLDTALPRQKTMPRRGHA